MWERWLFLLIFLPAIWFYVLLAVFIWAKIKEAFKSEGLAGGFLVIMGILLLLGIWFICGYFGMGIEPPPGCPF